MFYCIRPTAAYFAVGFWLDGHRWVQSSEWYVADTAQAEADRLNASLLIFRASAGIAQSDTR
jgi:hypothetical protein